MLKTGIALSSDAPEGDAIEPDEIMAVTELNLAKSTIDNF
jgi:hypothetical protein